MVRIVEVKLTLKSPAILAERRSASGFLGAFDYIPASTLRGAILTSLYVEGKVNEDTLSKEDMKPSLIASPAYPLSPKGKSRPASPFIWKCKKCELNRVLEKSEECDSEGGEDKKDGAILDQEEKFIKVIYENALLEIPSECREGHRALKPLHPELIPEPKRVVTRQISVGINKSRATAVKEMLYSYDVIFPPQTFWATLLLPEKYELNNRFEVMVGRGLSRGFGLTEIELQREISLEEKAEEYSNHIKGKTVVLFAMSPTLQGGFNPQPYPRTVNLSKIGEQLGLSIDGALQIERVYGKTVRVRGGWSLLTNTNRPDYYAKAQGSIIAAKVEAQSQKDAAKGLAVLAYHGTIEELNGFTITGVNMLRPALEVIKDAS